MLPLTLWKPSPNGNWVHDRRARKHQCRVSTASNHPSLLCESAAALFGFGSGRLGATALLHPRHAQRLCRCCCQQAPALHCRQLLDHLQAVRNARQSAPHQVFALAHTGSATNCLNSCGNRHTVSWSGADSTRLHTTHPAQLQLWGVLQLHVAGPILCCVGDSLEDVCAQRLLQLLGAALLVQLRLQDCQAWGQPSGLQGSSKALTGRTGSGSAPMQPARLLSSG